MTGAGRTKADQDGALSRPIGCWRAPVSRWRVHSGARALLAARGRCAGSHNTRIRAPAARPIVGADRQGSLTTSVQYRGRTEQGDLGRREHRGPILRLAKAQQRRHAPHHRSARPRALFRHADTM
jgi:hypothetical protein